jgi:hypothetical protein
MKRCPQCYEAYPDAAQFCELDGVALLVDVATSSTPGQVVETETLAQDSSARKREVQLMGVVGVMVGVLITSVAYTGYALLTMEPDVEERTQPVSRVETSESRPAPAPPRTAVLEPTPAPAEDSPTEEEVATEAEAAPATEADTVASRLNTGPVSTGQRGELKEERGGEKTIIQMTDGTSVEVDAAWADKQGIWYRRGGLVSFVESGRVKAITAWPETKPSPER